MSVDGRRRSCRLSQTKLGKYSSRPEAICTAEPEQKSVETETEQIARLAYAYWLEGGCQEGTAENDWIRAESELRGTSETNSMAVTA